MVEKPAFRNESALIAWVQKRTARRVPGLRLGIGDDAALVKIAAGQELILKTDMSIEGVHFTTALHTPRSVGHRALARSLSDIAAMGGTPRYALVSLALSRQAGRSWVKGLYQGLLALAHRFRVPVIGGDTAVVSDQTFIDVIVAGEVPEGTALRRSGARPGDQIFVSGRLGLAALGLRLLRSPAPRRTPETAAARRAHLYPEPQCALGRFLSEQRLATALMDISDGLAIDLHRLCDASGVGAYLLADRIPTPRFGDAADRLDLALHGGEDYQLLFTVAPGKMAQVPRRFRSIPLHCIGDIKAGKGVELATADGKSRRLKPQGYDHFARERLGE